MLNYSTSTDCTTYRKTMSAQIESKRLAFYIINNGVYFALFSQTRISLHNMILYYLLTRISWRLRSCSESKEINYTFRSTAEFTVDRTTFRVVVSEDIFISYFYNNLILFFIFFPNRFILFLMSLVARPWRFARQHYTITLLEILE